MNDFSKPTIVSDADRFFPANVKHLMPTFEEIPEDFRYGRPTAKKWIEFQQRWFYSGLEGATFSPREGIDPHLALRHLGCIQGSFEPKHEHKQAAVAYLASLWFEDWSAP